MASLCVFKGSSIPIRWMDFTSTSPACPSSSSAPSSPPLNNRLQLLRDDAMPSAVDPAQAQITYSKGGISNMPWSDVCSPDPLNIDESLPPMLLRPTAPATLPRLQPATRTEACALEMKLANLDRGSVPPSAYLSGRRSALMCSAVDSGEARMAARSFASSCTLDAIAAISPPERERHEKEDNAPVMTDHLHVL